MERGVQATKRARTGVLPSPMTEHRHQSPGALSSTTSRVCVPVRHLPRSGLKWCSQHDEDAMFPKPCRQRLPAVIHCALGVCVAYTVL